MVQVRRAVTDSQLQIKIYQMGVCIMANAKNGPVSKSVTITMDVFKDHTKVVQYRADDGTAVVTGGMYVSKSYLGKSPRRIEVSIREID